MNYSRSQIETYYRGRVPKLKQHGAEWRGPCPVHDGKDDNFAVDPATGRCFCHSQCQQGWDMAGLEMELTRCGYADAVARTTGISPPAERKVAEYDYRDEAGELLYQVIRYGPKTFHQRRPTAPGLWLWGLADVRRVLYRLPRIAQASPGVLVHIVAGEQDVETLERFDMLATCNSGGAGKWRPEYTGTLRGRPVAITPDNDEPGLKHGAAVARCLLGVAGAVWWMPLPKAYKDASDFFARGNGPEEWDAVVVDAVQIIGAEQIDALLAVPAKPSQSVVSIADRAPVELPKTFPVLPGCVQEGFAGEYLDLLKDTTEAPASFHMAALMTAAGCLMGRDVSIKHPRLVYGNLFTLLIGGTASARKTTALQFAADLAMGAALKLGVTIKPLYGIASVEGLALAMTDRDGTPLRVFAIEDEFRSLLKKGQQKGVANMIPRLTELYNHLPAFEVNTRADRICVNGFFLSLAAASTPAWFADSLTDLDIGGGFLNRWCVFTGQAERPIPRPAPVDRERWKKLVSKLARRVSTAARAGGGQRVMSAEAGRSYDEFYRRDWRRAQTNPHAEVSARTGLHALKFALIYSVLEEHLQIEADDIERGVALANYCGACMESLAERVGESRHARLERKIAEELRAGPATAAQLLRKFRVSADDLNRAIRALEYGGLIQLDREGGTGGRPRLVLRLAA
jgi:Protein of unknown function (DUF3987)/CHC2 zinc finger